MRAGPVLRAPLAAVGFLTRLPVGRLVDLDADDVGRGASLFPLVGGLVLGCCGLAADLLADALPPLVAGALAVGLVAVVTGSLHLDALADVADALGGSTPERRLEIMRDPALGAFGVVALVVVCLVDAAALGALANCNDAASAGLAAGAAGRAAMLPAARVLPYARPGEGQGRVLQRLSLSAVLAGVVLAVLLALPAGWAGLWGLGGAAVVAACLTAFWRQWVGGVTGDVLGATAKLAETAALVVALAVLAG